MTRQEDILRGAFRDREADIGDAADLMPGVRARVRRANRRRWIAASGAALVAVAAVFGGVAGLGSADRGDKSEDRGDKIEPLLSTVRPVPPGWRPESALGAQFAVPGVWKVNDYGCGMSQEPTVVKVQGLRDLCYFTESARKQVAVLVNSGEEAVTVPKAPSDRPYKVSGLDARRSEWRLPDGRYAGQIRVPGRGLSFDVRTLRQDLTTRILDSLEFVDVDFNGCPTGSRLAPSRPGGRPGSSFVDADPAAISVCLGRSPLQTSARFSGQAARELAAALNRAKPGVNRDRPDCAETSKLPDVVLLIEDRAGHVSPVLVTYTGCRNRGMDNGAQRAVLTSALLGKIMRPLKVGYGYLDPLSG